MTWDDETEAKYRQWHKEHYGVEPPKVKIKGVTMNKRKTGEITFTSQPTTGGGTMGIGANPENILTTFKPLVKCTRRPKGIAPGIEVITTRTAIIRLHIPERPAGMEKVIIRIKKAGMEDTTLDIDIEWPIGLSAYQALEAYFAKPEGRG